MFNPDVQNKALDDVKNELVTALEGDNADTVAEVQIKMMNVIKENILQEAKTHEKLHVDEMNDINVLKARGLNPLTKEERDYYNAVIDYGGFDGMDKVLPKTTINRVFEDLRETRPLLSKIDFVNTSAVTEWIIRTSDTEGAWWGPLCDEIRKQLSGAFDTIDMKLFKLSAFIPVCKAMLDLGPEWLDRFVREILGESIAIALELAIISGTGKEQPIGMIKDLDGAVVGGEYPDKTATELTNLTPATLGKEVMSPLTKDGKRNVDNVLIIVNPVDYWEKIFPQTTMLSALGSYVFGVLPIPATIITSSALAKGKMIAGLSKDYFMGIGSSATIEYSDHYNFLEDHRIYITKQYANGRPKDNESFYVFDISNMVVDSIPEA